MNDNNRFRNEKGFTLIEIIAVLVILGIIVAIAVPKYLDMASEARNKAARSAIDEVRGRLTAAQNKYLMNKPGILPTSLQLYDYATGADGYKDAANLANLGADFNVSVTSGPPILITVTAVKGANVSPGISDTFKALGDE
jgi:prepilin-type N-terminal cleavage/methylation domain-containing protein